MKTITKPIWVAVLLLALSACATQPEQQGPGAGAGGGTGVTTGTAGAGGEAGGEALGGEQRPAQTRVHFDFDSSQVSDADRKIIEENAAWLVAHPGAKVRLEGNCDERGTPEYNLALGERRAKAVLQIMSVLGVARDQMQAVSYGEEDPIDPGHNEAAWARNRRVDIVYQ
jgi:peptidoglycan-associated lipoprotein